MSVEQQGLLLVLTGPSGAGKDTVLNSLLNNVPDATRVVTYASRSKGPNEVDGVDYHFVSERKFQEMIAEDQFLEFAYYGGSYKGTTKGVIENVTKGEKVIWRIDMSAAARVQELFQEKFPQETAKEIIKRTTVVLIGVSNLTILLERSKERGRDFDKEEFLKRLRADWKVWSEFKFPHFVVNENNQQEQTVEKVLELIANHER